VEPEIVCHQANMHHSAAQHHVLVLTHPVLICCNIKSCHPDISVSTCIDGHRKIHAFSLIAGLHKCNAAVHMAAHMV